MIFLETARLSHSKNAHVLVCRSDSYHSFSVTLQM